MRLKQLAFMRVDRFRKRGQISAPNTFSVGQNIGTDDCFILVNIDLEGYDENSIENIDSVELILPPLMKKYQDKNIPYTDEEGNEQVRTEYGYFDVLGNNSGETPLITVDDLTWAGKDE